MDIGYGAVQIGMGNECSVSHTHPFAQLRHREQNGKTEETYCRFRSFIRGLLRDSGRGYIGGQLHPVGSNEPFAHTDLQNLELRNGS